MNLNFKKSDIKLIVAVIFILAAVGAYYYCNMTLSAKTDAYNAENAGLESEVAYLQDLMNHKAEYVAETESMQTEIDDIVSQFPADVKPEDQIMYANALELDNALLVQNVGMPGKEYVTLAVAAPAPEAAPVQDSIDDTAEAVPVDDSQAVAAPAAGLASTISLYRSPTTISFKSTYKSLKDVLDSAIKDVDDKKSIDTLSVAFDAETGNLNGTIIMSLYSIMGGDEEYVAPTVNGVKKGTANIFGTTEDVNALRSTTTAAVTDADTNTEKAEETEAADSNKKTN